MDYWNDQITEKSWRILQGLKGFNFVLIGGWAAYLWTNLHKSKDIDIIICDYNDLNFLKKNYNLKKNDHLNKYEIQVEDIDIDIYVPYFSKLSIPVEDIREQTTLIQNFHVVKPEALLILKQGAEIDREKSIKGEKDRIDIMTILLNVDLDFRIYHEILSRYSVANYSSRLKTIIKDFKDTKYLNITPRELKLKKKDLLDKLKVLKQ